MHTEQPFDKRKNLKHLRGSMEVFNCEIPSTLSTLTFFFI